jgi:hypothetical protein
MSDVVATAADTTKSGPLVRAAALVAGVVVLMGGVIVSLGGVVLAPIGMAVADHVQRRRGRPLTPGGYWIVACSSMPLAVAVAAGALLSTAPKGTVANVMHAADSSSAAAAKQPPPAWLDRLAPGYRVQQARMEPSSRVVAVLTTIFGVGFALTFFSTLYGSVGWGVGMLLGLAFRGSWPGVREESADDLMQVAHPRAAAP